MKNKNIVFIAMASALAFVLGPVTEANIIPQGGPTLEAAPANHQPSPEDVQLPAISIYSAGDIARGKTGSFVLKMSPAIMFGGTYVNFKLSGTAAAGVDYVAFASPAYIGQSGYATILVHTLADPRGSSNRQAYSVVVTLEAGAGYALGAPSSATIWIKP
jgi:hypothetical protein